MIGSRARVVSNPGGACWHTVSRHGATTFRVATSSPCGKEGRREEAHPRLARIPNAISRVVAFRETEQNKDWRIEQMVESARTYYYKIWTKGDENMCDKLFDDNIVYRDNIWHDSDLIVGVKALRDHIRQTRQAYPDVHFVIQEVGVCSTSRLFVQWECGGSNLCEFHGRRPTRHYSHTRGVDMLTFNDSREKLVEVSSFRQATKEEQLEQASYAGADGGMPEIRLVPLVYN